MGFADVWNRTLVYFGIAEEDEDWDEDGYVTNEELERSYSERPNVRRLSPRRRKNEFEDWTDPQPQQGGAQTADQGVCASGLTLSYLLRNFQTRNPASLRVCAFLAKQRERPTDLRLDYVGREVPDVFVVGYGLDRDERYRNLPYIAEFTGDDPSQR